MNDSRRYFARRKRATGGFSLIEIMVALVIGLVLIGGAMQVYLSSKASYSVNESTARLQETARYALSVLEPDIRMAGNWGLAPSHLLISGRQPQPTTTVPAPTQITTECGYNYAVDLSQPVQGNNNGYVLGANPITNCTPFANSPRASSDTLTVRFASLIPAAAASGRWQLCTSRGGAQRLTTDLTAAPLCTAPSRISNLTVNGYYVANESNPGSGGANVPSLRVKQLRAGDLQFEDNEIIEGIEDLQVQFGIDPGFASAATTAGMPLDHCGFARFYVNPGEIPAAVEQPQIVSVRIWLMVRSDTPETGFVDNITYEYADRLAANGTTGDLSDAAAAGFAYTPASNPAVASFRRLLVSRTFQVRNAEMVESVATDPSNPCQ